MFTNVLREVLGECSHKTNSVEVQDLTRITYAAKTKKSTGKKVKAKTKKVKVKKVPKVKIGSKCFRAA